MKIQDLVVEERPYEKSLKYGIETLTNAELIAIILKSGTKNKSSIELANEVLKSTNGKIRDVFFGNLDNLEKINGIGKIKKINFEAISEIIKRVERPIINSNNKVKSTKDVAKLFIPEMRYEKLEKLKMLILDSKNNIRKVEEFSTNHSNKVDISPIEIVKCAIKNDATKVILIHNHPSGDPTPSKADINYTKEVVISLKEFQIEFLDHIVIGDGEFESVINYL